MWGVNALRVLYPKHLIASVDAALLLFSFLLDLLLLRDHTPRRVRDHTPRRVRDAILCVAQYSGRLCLQLRFGALHLHVHTTIQSRRLVCSGTLCGGTDYPEPASCLLRHALWRDVRTTIQSRRLVCSGTLCGGTSIQSRRLVCSGTLSGTLSRFVEGRAPSGFQCHALFCLPHSKPESN